MRNNERDIVEVKGSKLPDLTDKLQEVSISKDIQFCMKGFFLLLIIETDSLSMINITEERWEVTWCVVKEVEIIINRMREG